MKKTFLFVFAALLFGGVAFADTDNIIGIPDGFNVKSGMLVKWDSTDGEVKMLSTVAIMKTQPWEALGGWNALWDGWTLDVGAAYDSNGVNAGALLVGREFGTLGKYIPLDFPLKDQINITIYPFGAYIEDPFGNMSIHGASGIGLVKLSVSF